MARRYDSERVSADSVERALEVHVREGRLRGYKAHPDGGWLADIAGYGPARLKTAREGHVFVLGLMAARNCQVTP